MLRLLFPSLTTQSVPVIIFSITCKWEQMSKRDMWGCWGEKELSRWREREREMMATMASRIRRRSMVASVPEFEPRPGWLGIFWRTIWRGEDGGGGGWGGRGTPSTCFDEYKGLDLQMEYLAIGRLDFVTMFIDFGYIRRLIALGLSSHFV